MPQGRDTDRAFFDAKLRAVKKDLEASLVAFFEEERAGAKGSREIEVVARAVADLSLRGGKRFRAALCAIAFEGFGGGDFHACMPALVALEMLQVYFLIHDDLMDGDDTRRGGPSVPAMLRAELGAGAFADAATILAGDYAAALAQRAIAETPGKQAPRACAQLAQISRGVIFGQLLDMANEAGRAADSFTTKDVERTYLLKTGTYTVRGPLELGAMLADASKDALDAIARFADPLGIAFQLADDLISLFGEEKETGKPQHGDLRAGKRTWIVADAMSDASVRAAMRGAFGEKNASVAATTKLAQALVDSGAKSRAEARLHALADEARRELTSLTMTADTKRALAGAIVALTERAS